MLEHIGIITFDNLKILGKGFFGTIYEGLCCRTHDKIAVKKIDVDDCENEDYLETLNHPNVVRLYVSEKKGRFRFYALEKCDGSMDRLFLPKDDGIKKKLSIDPSVMPSDKEVLLQLARGLEHIHSRMISHRDVKPENVLISVRGNEVTFKWADFGLCKPVSEERGTYTQSYIRGTLCWISPEVMEMENRGTDNRGCPKGSTKSDIWSAGCVFFYYLMKGIHLFGSLDNDVEVLLKIKENDPVNLCQLQFGTFYDVILDMIDPDPFKRLPAKEIIQILEGEKKGNKIKLIDSITFGLTRRENKAVTNVVDVFRGKYKNGIDDVVVKRVYLDLVKPEDGFRRLRHENVVKLLYAESDHKFRYFAFELCVASMDQLFRHYDPVKLSMKPPADNVLLQIAKGLLYIHENHLVYGRVKPENILFFEKNGNNESTIQVKWADFGIIEKSLNNTEIGSEFWTRSPEWPNSISSDDIAAHFTVESDIWFTGGIFYYFLTNGPRHTQSLSTDEDSYLKKIPYEARFAKEVIRKMMITDPSKRMGLLEAIKEMDTQFKSIIPIETEILKLCSISNPSETEVDQLCSLLSKEGINLNCTTLHGSTPLTILCNNLDEEYHDSHHCRSVLYLARQMKKNKVKPVIHRSELIEEKFTPLHLLCKYYRKREVREIIETFIKLGVDPTSKEANGLIALDYLYLKYQHDDLLDIVNIFVGNGVNLRTEISEGVTSLHWLFENYKGGKLVEIVQLYVDTKNINVKSVDLNGRNLLCTLCENYSHESLVSIVRLLIEAGVDPSSPDNEGFTPLYYLCWKYRQSNLIDILPLFLDDDRVDVNATDNYAGFTPLDVLCSMGYNQENLIDIIQLFITAGVDLGDGGALAYLLESYPHENVLLDIVYLLKINELNKNNQQEIANKNVFLNKSTYYVECLEKNDSIQNKERMITALLNDDA